MGTLPDEQRARVLASAIDACAGGGPEALERICAEHPDLAEEIRSAVRVMGELRAGSGAPEEEIAKGLGPGRVLGRFRILGRLGHGGMGVVFRARDTTLGRDVAIKVLPASLALLPEALERFRREARALAHLRHPHIVAIHEVGETTDGVSYFAMDLVEGASLDAILRRLAGSSPPTLRAGDLRPVPAEGGSAERTGSYVEAVVRLAAKVADALEHAHRAGVVHRDVKPGNILVDGDGEPHLADFGLARDFESAVLTRTGATVGTPCYMAPEQVSGTAKAVGPRTDVYALGATLYEALTLRRPFPGDVASEVFRQVLSREPVRPRKLNASISPDLETVCLKALEKDPDRRYATAGEFAEDLRNLLELRPIRARSAGPLTRTTKWARRNRLAAFAGATVAAAVLAVPAVLFVQGHAEVRSRIAEAERRLSSYLQDLRALRDIEARFGPLRFAITSHSLSQDERKRFISLEDELIKGLRMAEQGFFRVAESIEAVERLDPGNPTVARIRAEAFAERWQEAVRKGDESAAVLYLEALRKIDEERVRRTEDQARGRLSLRADPADSEVFLFRFREQADLIDGGDRRLVPVPHRGRDPAVAPGAWCLRVVRRAGDLEEGDLILRVAGYPVEGTVLVAEGNEALGILPCDRLVSIDRKEVRDINDLLNLGVGLDDRLINEANGRDLADREFVFERHGESFAVRRPLFRDLGIVAKPADALARRGGVAAEVYHLGEVRNSVLPAKLAVRATAAPLPISSFSSVGRGKIEEMSLEPGSYVALIRHPTFDDQRYPFLVPRGGRVTVKTRLQSSGTEPPGFVFVAEGPFIRGGDLEAPASDERSQQEVEDFWIMDQEVTVDEYAEFMSDPEIRREVEEAPELVYHPREPGTPRRPLTWIDYWNEELGRYVATDYGKPFPMSGISWSDADRYARWRDERARARGELFTFSLPSPEEWEKAARGADGRFFPYGNRFVPWWMSTRLARVPYGTSIGGSFPVDESPYGVFDLGGNLAEMVTRPQGAASFGLRGGSWVNLMPASFRLAGRQDETMSVARSYFGMRLVAHRVR
ncbi:MAG TPA: bifunctional serine/threonine-protein kinase/formylglycine-generating enzyme family protein [Planctomycetota bacterium]|jgi:formylglycine-generating enzyme required for sulfatase activity/tRNA A-37 threonylcarbamoyl transferase component Bud32|nr:bifunctional serine/threonine-protein kinase/formylglycine-generating enzyme family protein [Planctomycetota bacterium]